MDKAAVAFHAATGWPHLPLRERVADKLADVLFASDEVLEIIRGGRADHVPDAELAAIEKVVASFYEQVNEVMAAITD
jgi:hypothetical protein